MTPDYLDTTARAAASGFAWCPGETRDAVLLAVSAERPDARALLAACGGARGHVIVDGERFELARGSLRATRLPAAARECLADLRRELQWGTVAIGVQVAPAVGEPLLVFVGVRELDGFARPSRGQA